MSTKQSPSENQQPTTTGKMPYEKPSFRHEQVFVTTALSCNKTGQQAQCGLVIKVS